MNSPHGLDPITHVSDIFPSWFRYAGVMYGDHNAAKQDLYSQAGDKTFVLAVNHSWSVSGLINRTYFDQYYNVIHVTPQHVRLGNILTSLSRPVRLWNAYLTTKPVESFVASTTEGFGTVEPREAPYTLLPLEELEYTVSVAESGPPSFADEMTWVIDGETLTVSITGNRVVLWAFEPNWGQPLNETLSWKTTIIKAFDETEQRQQKRANPRKVVEYSSVATGNQVTKLSTLLLGWQNRLFAVPTWQDRSTLSDIANSGDTVITLDLENRSFNIDKLGVIFLSDTEFEVFEILNKSGSNLELAEPLENNWVAGTRVYPLDLARANQTVTYQHHTSNTVEFFQEWNMVPGDTSFNFEGEGVSETFRGSEVVTIKPNWGALVTVEPQFDYEMFDSDVGLFEQVQIGSFPSVTYSYEWMLKNKTAIQNFRAFLNRVKGRLKSFYIPSQINDMVVTQGVNSTSSSFYVKSAQLSRYVNVHPVRNAVIIMFRDGNTLTAGVTGISAHDSETEVVSIDTVFGQAYSVDDIVKVSFLHLCRLASDEISIEHLTDSVARVNMRVRTLQT